MKLHGIYTDTNLKRARLGKLVSDEESVGIHRHSQWLYKLGPFFIHEPLKFLPHILKISFVFQI